MPGRDRRRETATCNFQTSMYRVRADRKGSAEMDGILRAARCARCDREVARR
jgi:hypothetical protein